MPLLASGPTRDPDRLALAPQAFCLRAFARSDADALIDAIDLIAAAAPFRHMTTRGGFSMSVAMTNCGALGWISDRRGYRYSPLDPDHGRDWPAMPATFHRLAHRAAAACGFAGFDPDACLINRYVPGARMALHQDRDERDFAAPIVSVSLGLPAVFLFGGVSRSDRPHRIDLQHGDVVVWGGADRLRFHGIRPLADGWHPRLGAARLNLTFRKAG